MAGLGLKISTEPWKIKSVTAHAAHQMFPTRKLPRGCTTSNGHTTLLGFGKFSPGGETHGEATWAVFAVVIVGHEKKFHTAPLDGESWRKILELIDLGGKSRWKTCRNSPLAGADLILSNDSGIYFISGISLNRPTVAVGGSVEFRPDYFPYPQEAESAHQNILYRPVACGGCNWRCIHTPSRTETAWCLQQVGWEEMADAADKLLAQVS